MKCPLKHVRMSIIKNTKITSAGKDVEKKELSCAADGI